ncbi:MULTISPECIES: type VII secretion target [unclassified Streptomyces]|uniref:type VII secretion target n=1 Tax=unclassified Streptomyces TaxID=2593676 RepID=UPI00278C2340|nr:MULTISPECIES: type VII secretion target [unclassified Streptomyces]
MADMAHTIDINAARVRATADDTESLARQTAKRLSHSLDTSDEVRASHPGPGWHSPAELQACARAWEEHMVSLAKRMGELSEKLRDSADSYDRADAEAESRLHAGLNALGGDHGRA